MEIDRNGKPDLILYRASKKWQHWFDFNLLLWKD
jgi:hypothetical protein